MGQSAGIAHSPASDITQLRKLLDDQYSDQTIFRELAQNADDAEATWVMVRCFERGPGGGHPLLDGPGVLVVNNGYFRHADDEAIRRLGAGTKGGDAAAIGKFGLGLKSIFHWCEAFFYLASADQPGAGGETAFCRLFNPWGELRAEWDGDHFENQIAPLVTETIAEALPPEAAISPWFALYIPLRRSAQWSLNAAEAASRSPIRSGEPNATTLFPPTLCIEISGLLPLLRHVQRITFRVPEGAGFVASLEDNAIRTLGPDAITKKNLGSDRLLSGSVIIERDGYPPQPLEFQGVEHLAVGDRIFQQIRQHPDWPKIMAFDAKTEKSEDRPEKGEPHGAVICSWTAPAAGIPSGLSVREAVFLPLEGDVSTEFPLGCIRFILHGFYFVDAGRRALHRGGDIQTEWNNTVRRRATLPLVLPALARFVEKAQFDAAATAQLTEGLNRALSADPADRHALLGQYQWLPRLTSGANPMAVYRLCAVAEPYFALPSATRNALPYRLFPRLREAADRHHLLFDDAPLLTLRPAGTWDALSDYFSDCDVAAAYEDDARRDYLKTLLATIGPMLSPAVWANILTAFSSVLAGNLSEFQQANRIAADVIDVLRRLSEEQRGILRPSIKDISLFRVTDNSLLRQGEPSSRLASWAELDKAREDSLLFTNTGKEVAEALQKAVATGKILRVTDAALLSLLFGPGHGVGNCDADACIRLLQTTRLPLASPSRRVALLRKLIPDRDSGFQGANRHALRYLLHGERTRFEDSSSLLASDEGRGQVDDVWGRIARVILDGGVASWRVIDKALADELNPREKEKLGVESIGPAWVESTLLEKRQVGGEDGFASFVATLPWQPERDSAAVLGRIQSPTLFKALPLHRTAQDTYVALTNACYVQSDLEVPKTLHGVVTLIREPADPAIREAYRQARVYSWAPRHVIFVALSQPEPERFHQEVLDALYAFAEGGENPTGLSGTMESVLNRIRETPWLPLRSSPESVVPPGPVPPREVIDLPSASDALERLMASPAVNRTYATPEVLHSAVREHPAFPYLREHCFARGSHAVDPLLLCIETWAADQQRGLGDLFPPDATTDVLKDFLEVFHDLPEGVAPELSLLRVFFAAADVGSTVTLRIVREALVLPVPDDTIVAMLHFLACADEPSAGSTVRLRARPWYLSLLRLLRQRYQQPLAKFDLRLRNKVGQWRTAEQLCWNVPNAPDEWMLEEESGVILFGRRSQQRATESDPAEPRQDGSSETRTEANSTAGASLPHRSPLLSPSVRAAIRQDTDGYLAVWSEAVPPGIIGAFLSVLANNKDAQQAADGYLGYPGDAQAMRVRLGLPAEGTTPFLVRVATIDGGIEAENLAGERVTIPLRSDIQTLLAGNPRRDMGDATMMVPLCRVDPASWTKEERKELWRATVTELLGKMLQGGRLDVWDDEWQRLSQPEQTDLEMTQDILLDSLFQYLKQGLQGGLTSLKTLRERTEGLQRRQFEAERLRDGSEREKTLLEVLKQRRALREDLRHKIEHDPVTQCELLAAVRRKMEQFEYRTDSMPFELFQNADDAAVEWAEMGGSVEAASCHLEETETGLRFRHRGRPINVFRRGAFSAEQGQRRGFDRDLEKMLVLQMSDKAEGGADHLAPASSVTGKFGLGFKSVFLYADRVLVESGDLSFAVLGGVFPARCEGADTEAINNANGKSAGSGGGGNLAPQTTLLFEKSHAATADGDAGAIQQEMLQRFRSRAPVLTVFARCIKECRAGNETFRWSPTLVPGTQEVFCGRMRLPGEPFALFVRTDHRSAEGTASATASADNTGILFQLGASGIEAFKGDIPTLWVTAPTRDGAVTGFAVNGAFAVDVGRAQLAADSRQSEEEAERIGYALGRSLVELFDAMTGKQAGIARAVMGLAADTTPHAFWTSLWKLLARPVSGSQTAKALLCSVLWSEGRGYSQLLAERATLPTGLPGAYDVLTRLPCVRFRVQGLIDNHGAFGHIANWPGVSSDYPPGQLVSQERVADVLGREGIPDTSVRATPLCLEDILVTILAGKNVTPEQAEQFGALIRRSYFTEAGASGGTLAQEEVRRLQTYLTTLRFISKAGTAQTANDLLLTADALALQPDRVRVRADAEEEARRAAFAPDRHLLDSAYLTSEGAIAFLLACRGERQIRVDRAENLAEWGQTASDPTRQAAFLAYLVDGDLAPGVAAYLKPESVVGTWLEDFSTSAVFQNLNEQTQASVALRLRPAESAAALIRGGNAVSGGESDNASSEDEDYGYDADTLGQGTLESQPVPVSPLSPEVARDRAQRLSALWSNESARLHKDYDERTYPQGGAFFQYLIEEPPRSTEARKAWLTLLLRGSLESMGRANAGQHRNFLSLCEQSNWLSTLSTYGSGDSADILRHFEKWLSEKIEDAEYFHWVRYFLPIAFTVRYLDDYSHAFLGLNEVGDDFRMQWVNSPSLSPTRVIVPPLRPLLGVGTHFVLRELARKGVVTNPAVYPCCFVPVKPVLDTAREWGASFHEGADREALSRAVYDTVVNHGAADPTFQLAFDIALRGDGGGE